MNFNENGKRRYDPTYFSRLSFTDQNSKLRLGFRFSSGMLIPSISKLKSETGFEYETLEEIWITPTKARILVEALDDAMEKLFGAGPVGIITGLKETVSVIIIDPEKVIIGKVNGAGKFVSQQEVKWNENYHNSFSWNDVAANDFEKVYHDDIELMMFRDLLNDFAHAMPGAYAYSVVDLARFDTNRQNNLLKPVYEKLGIEWGNGSNGGGSQYSGNNFFTNNTRNNSGGSAEHKDFDEAMDELPFE